VSGKLGSKNAQNLCVLLSCHVGCRRQESLLCVCDADACGVAYLPGSGDSCAPRKCRAQRRIQPWQYQ